jgi:hypothetical protein
MTRADSIKTERRRRNSDGLAGRGLRLRVDEAHLDRTKFEYRWANDTDNRVFDLTKADDWEVVPDREGGIRPDSNGVGAEVSVPVGGGQRSVLLRKLKDYHNDDELAKRRAIDETENAMRQGATPGAGSSEVQSNMKLSREA